MRKAIVVATSIAVAGCAGDSLGPLDAGPQLEVQSADLALIGASVRGSVDVLIVNSTPFEVMYHPNATRLLRSVSGEWIGVWWSLSLEDSKVVIEPGAEHVARTLISASADSRIWDPWTAPIDGSYELELGIVRTDGVVLDSSVRFSLPHP